MSTVTETSVGGPTAAGVETANGYITGFGSVGYRSYVLTVLLFIYILNFVDRALLSVVARPLKADLGIGDTAFGLLTGFGFALLYSVLGVPIARLAETRHRVWIMAICLALWSLMTALCGLSQEIVIGSLSIGAFWVLLTCRIGVGIGEAGCTPPANSLIADYYPPSKRSTALGYYAMGVNLGTAISNLIGGPITDMFDWRVAFFVLGLPGVAVAILLKVTVKEPPRGYTDPPGAVKSERAALSAAIKELLSKPSFWLMTVGATLAAFCGYAIASFQSLYLQRTFDLSAGQAAVNFNVPAYVASALGTVFIGWLAERMSRRDETAIAWMPAVGLIACVPVYWWAFTTNSQMYCLIALTLAGFMKYGYLAAQYTIGQGVASLRVRATAIAVMLFVINLLGYGFGPLFAGVVSDIFFRGSLADAGLTGVVTRPMCDAAQEAVNVASRSAQAPLSATDISPILTGLDQPLTDAQFAFCNAANASSTETSMLFTTSIYALAGLFFLLCARFYKRDLVAR
ncbi:MAG: spinster family MFS transporter [Amphiplicatus sp.]